MVNNRNTAPADKLTKDKYQEQCAGLIIFETVKVKVTVPMRNMVTNREIIPGSPRGKRRNSSPFSVTKGGQLL